MLWKVLSCPQCSAPLPKQARWRIVTCPYCKAVVGLGQEVVSASTFRDAWARAQATLLPVTSRVGLGRQSFRLLGKIAEDAHHEIFWTERLLPTPAVASLELAFDDVGAAALRQAAHALTELRRSEAAGAAVFTRRLPLVLALGTSAGPHGAGRLALALRHPPGAWGHLGEVLAAKPGGVEATHAVWIWRRILESLGFVHDSGWVHHEVKLEHLIVHPADHLVHLVGWSHARLRQITDPSPAALIKSASPQRDLVQSGWAIRALISGDKSREPSCDNAPRPLAELLQRVTEDPDFVARLDARTLADQVSAAARQAFGPPRFVHFHLPN